MSNHCTCASHIRSVAHSRQWTHLQSVLGRVEFSRNGQHSIHEHRSLDRAVIGYRATGTFANSTFARVSVHQAIQSARI